MAHYSVCSKVARYLEQMLHTKYMNVNGLMGGCIQIGLAIAL